MSIFVRKLGSQGGTSFRGAMKLKQMLDGEEVPPPKSIRSQLFGDKAAPRQGGSWGWKRFTFEDQYKLIGKLGAGASEREVLALAEKMKPQPAAWLVKAFRNALKTEAENLRSKGRS